MPVFVKPLIKLTLNDFLVAIRGFDLGFSGNGYSTASTVITSQGDLRIGNSVGAAERLAIGSSGKVLESNGSTASWETISTADSVLTTQGDLIYEGASALARLGQSTNNYTLATKGSGANPAWQPSATSLFSAAGDILYASGANTLAKLAKASDGDTLQLASGVPAWVTVSAASGSLTFLKKVTSVADDTQLDSGTFTAYEELFFTYTAPSPSNGEHYEMIFNDNDSDTYHWRYGSNGETDSTGNDARAIKFGGTGDDENLSYGVIHSSTTMENLVIGHAVTSRANGEWTTRSSGVGGDRDTSNPVTSVQIQLGASSTLSTGSILTIWGMAKT